MEAAVYTLIKESIRQKLKIDLENYKAEQMQRRLDSWLVRTRSKTWRDYFDLLTVDANELERFRNYLTINVTEFFRDPHRWNIIASEILPYLTRNLRDNQHGDTLRLWSAGCSIGAEPYTLAIVMAEAFPQQKYSLLATDLDRGALQKARSGGPYTQEEMRNLNSDQQARFISGVRPYFVQESLRNHIRFEEQDLLATRFETEFDLIICRNVVIYFTAEAKETLYSKFCAALRRGGVLFLGGTEIISGPSRFGLQNFGPLFYRKL